MPLLSFKSNAKPSTFGYPPPLEEKKKEDKEKVATAVLSITARQKKKEAEKKKEKEGEKMEVDEEKKEKKEEAKDKDKDKSDKSEDKDKDKKKEEEPNFELRANPARVIKPQMKVISLEDSVYEPIKDIGIGGIIMMRNTTGEACQIVEPVPVAKFSSNDSEGEEPEPPEPFTYVEADD